MLAPAINMTCVFKLRKQGDKGYGTPYSNYGAGELRLRNFVFKLNGAGELNYGTPYSNYGMGELNYGTPYSELRSGGTQLYGTPYSNYEEGGTTSLVQMHALAPYFTLFSDFLLPDCVSYITFDSS